MNSVQVKILILNLDIPPFELIRRYGQRSTDHIMTDLVWSIFEIFQHLQQLKIFKKL